MYSISIGEDNLWTPSSNPPPGYKLVIHRYYTEVVPIGFNIPKTPVKPGRFIYDRDEYKYSKRKLLDKLSY